MVTAMRAPRLIKPTSTFPNPNAYTNFFSGLSMPMRPAAMIPINTPIPFIIENGIPAAKKVFGITAWVIARSKPI